jgi:hypothetical protein
MAALGMVEQKLLEALLDRYERTAQNGGHLLEINGATAHLKLPHWDRVSGWERLRSRGLLTAYMIDVDGESNPVWAYRLELDEARQALEQARLDARELDEPEALGPRLRLSSLAAGA